jgi:predicted PurR-regulated permease PerM
MADVPPPLKFKPEVSTPGLLVSSASALFIGLAIVAVLYFGREIFMPLALAVLLSFALAPLVELLRRWHVPRVGAVTLVVLAAFVVIGAMGTIMARQVAQLAENLPRYQITIGKKIESLRDAASGGGVLEQITHALGNLRQEISKPAPPAEAPATPAQNPPPSGAGNAGSKPVPVEIQQQPPKPLEIIQTVLSPILAPLATTGIVVVFAIFILLYRQDLRDRFIRLAGARDIGRTTAAMDDAASRLSRYLLTQTCLNASFGVIIGTGLWLIGIPNPVLWGIFGALMRFVPYIGAFIAAAFPAALAIAVDPGWSMLIWTIALFVVIEPIMGQVVEPLLYGHNTGLSPMAVVVAATFWTWLWGPIGLLLSTPLTACLVVLGRHVERLQFLEVILGDEPALAPEQNFYQRMLADDPHEAADQAEQFLKERSLSAFYDEVALPGLVLAQADLNDGRLEADKLTQIRDAVHEVVDDLSDHEDKAPEAKSGPDDKDESKNGKPAASPKAAVESRPPPAIVTKEELAPAWREGAPVLCIGTRTPLDDAAATMLAQLLQKHGIGARCEPREALATANIFRLDTAGVLMVCLSCLDVSRPVEVRYLVRRARRRFPNAVILVGLWRLANDAADGNYTAGKNLPSSAEADLYATSLREAVDVCIEAARIKEETDAGRPGRRGAAGERAVGHRSDGKVERALP